MRASLLIAALILGTVSAQAQETAAKPFLTCSGIKEGSKVVTVGITDNDTTYYATVGDDFFMPLGTPYHGTKLGDGALDTVYSGEGFSLEVNNQTGEALLTSPEHASYQCNALWPDGPPHGGGGTASN